MKRKIKSFRRALLPIAVFAAVMLIHFLWQGFFSPEASWVSLDSGGTTTWLRRYIEKQSYWMGYSYALPIAFAAVALRRYREERFCKARNLTIAGVTFSGFLALFGCYLLGCCGSPMLIVYLNLLGTSFLPFAKPILAAVTTLTIFGAWLWMNHKRQRNGTPVPAKLDEKNVGCDCT